MHHGQVLQILCCRSIKLNLKKEKCDEESVAVRCLWMLMKTLCERWETETLETVLFSLNIEEKKKKKGAHFPRYADNL